MRPLARIPEAAPQGAEASPSLRSAEQFLRGVFDERRVAGRIRVFSFPAPTTSPTAMLELANDDRALLFEAPSAPAFAAIGACAEIRVIGDGRFDALRRESSALFERIEVVEAEGSLGVAPRLVGGLSFVAGIDHGATWEGFGDGLFFLPRWSYVVEGGHACLALATLDDDSNVDEILVELRRIWEHLGRRGHFRRPPRTKEVRHFERDAWRRSVEAIRGSIFEGEAEKIVAARRARVLLDHDVSASVVVDRLRSRFPHCTRFAMLGEGAAFLGATPEKLVERRGTVVTTEALAGSIARGRADDLLSSAKDRDEHRLVVEAIVDALRPLCSQVSVAGERRIRELPDVLHIETPIEGRALEGVQVLDLVEALHPTPAVCGVPKQVAREWIVSHEAEPRGWYGGPFGWIDRSGDGSFAVALRSGVLRGREAFVYAGAGIVRDSEPDAEYEETALKMRALLGALDEDEGQ